MALFVNTNVSSINGRTKLNAATNNLNTTYQRLSSGLRINGAKDDAAGLAISDRMTAQINGLQQANRNASDGIALAQTTEGAMNEITNMLHRMRTLAVQSSNGTNTQSDRESLDKEFKSLSEEISRISEKTTFNGQQVLSGLKGSDKSLLTQGTAKFQVGANSNDLLDIEMKQGFSFSQLITGETVGKAFESMFGNGIELTISSAAGAKTDLTGIATEIQTQMKDNPGQTIKVDITHAALADFVKGSSAKAGNTVGDNFTAMTDILFDQSDVNIVAGKLITNGAKEDGTVYTLKGKHMEEMLLAAQKATGTNYSDRARGFFNNVLGIEVKADSTLLADKAISDVDKAKSNIQATFSLVQKNVGGTVLDGTSRLSQVAIGLMDGMIAAVDAKRADLGAVQNRLESTIRNQQNIIENTSDARSRIRDTDFAEETANLSQQTIIQQAAQSMLMQANQRPQMALSLLG